MGNLSFGDWQYNLPATLTAYRQTHLQVDKSANACFVYSFTYIDENPQTTQSKWWAGDEGLLIQPTAFVFVYGWQPRWIMPGKWHLSVLFGQMCFYIVIFYSLLFCEYADLAHRKKKSMLDLQYSKMRIFFQNTYENVLLNLHGQFELSHPNFCILHMFFL